MRDPAELLRHYQLAEDDLARIREAGALILPRLQEFIDRFYAWLPAIPEYAEFFSDPEVLERVKRHHERHWQFFFRGVVDEEYVQHCVEVGATHARIGLPLGAYVPAASHAVSLMAEMIGEAAPDGAADLIRSVTKAAHLDLGLIVSAYTRVIDEAADERSRLLAEMSTPVSQVWDRILMLPVVGVLDSKRAQDIMAATLARIAEVQAREFILDITGVAVVDTAVANHLIKITQATKLMGCESTISGISPAIAQTIVDLGIDVGGVRTTATMRAALAGAFERLGLTVSEDA